MSSSNETQRWSSELGFVMATAAAAVGLGNIWRFPYIAGDSGGGTFIIAYIICVVACGLPLMLLEISSGRAERYSPVGMYRRLHKKTSWFGWLVVVLTGLIMSYYLVVTGWTLGYAVNSLTFSVTDFDTFTAGYQPLIYFFIVSGITGYVVWRGLKSIEKLSKILMPLLLIIILGLTGYSLTLEGRGEALAFFFTPELSEFANPRVWLLAMGQAFYSLAVGQGYLITYGSFFPRKGNLPRATASIAAFETIIALIAGLMIFPIVFTFNLDPDQGAELAFSTLPKAFETIAIGPLLAILFFNLFFLAAISSCIAGMEVIKNTIKQEFRLPNGPATAVSFLPIIPLGILSALSYTPIGITILGRPFLDAMDFFGANQTVVTIGVIGGAIIAWTIPKRALTRSFGKTHQRIAHTIILITRFLPIPIILLLLLTLIIPN